MQRRGIPSLERLDGMLRGSKSVFDWLQDVHRLLWNEGYEEPRYVHECISVCRRALACAQDLDVDYTIELRARIGDRLVDLDEDAAADAEFEAMLRERPTDGYVWARWAQAFGYDERRQGSILARARGAGPGSARARARAGG